MLIIRQKNISTFNTLKLVYGYLFFFVTRSKNCLFYCIGTLLSWWQTSIAMMSQNVLLNDMSFHTTLGIAPYIRLSMFQIVQSYMAQSSKFKQNKNHWFIILWKTLVTTRMEWKKWDFNHPLRLYAKRIKYSWRAIKRWHLQHSFVGAYHTKSRKTWFSLDHK